MADKATPILIVNDCEQCGRKYSYFAHDPPKTGIGQTIKRQKEYIATQHKGHDYSLKSYVGGKEVVRGSV